MRRSLQPALTAIFILGSIALSACGDANPSGGAANNGAGNNGAGNNGPGNNGPGNNGPANNGPANNGPGNNGGSDIRVLAGGPNDALDHAAIYDPRTLDIEIDVEGSGPVAGGAHLVNFSFTSQTYGGNVWRHQASLYLPLEPSNSGFLAVVDREEDFGSNPTVSWTGVYGIGTAVANGVPVLVLNDLPGIVDLNTPEIAPYTDGIEGRCKGAPQQQMDVMARCMLQVMHNGAPLSLDPFLAIGVAYMRAISAAQILPDLIHDTSFPDDEKPPGFNVTQAVLFGGQHRAVGAQVAAGADTRVKAILVSTGAFGALDEYFALQQDVWGEGHTLGDPTEWIAFLRTPEGAAYKAALDPVEWPAELLAGKRVLRGWGTQMTFSPLRAFDLYRASLPEETYDFVVRDAGDGIQTQTHAALWQGIFLPFAQGARPMTRVTSFFDDDRGNIAVTAQVAGEASLDGVVILYVQRHRDTDDEDFRDAVWEAAAMEPKNADFVGSFAPLGRNSAYVVFARDQLITGETVSESVVASPVVVTP